MESAVSVSQRPWAVGGVALVPVGAVLLFMILAYPMVLSLLYIKAALFGVLLVVAALKMFVRGRVPIRRGFVIWTLLLCVVAFLFFLYGALVNLPNAWHEGQVYFLWPAIYLVLLSLVVTEDALLVVYRVMIFSSIYIGVYGLIYSMQQFGLIPAYKIVNLLSFGDIQGVGLHGDYMQVLIAGLNSLPFLFPFVLTLLFVSYNSPTRPVGRKWLWLSLGLQLALILISGRRALWVVVIASPVLLYLLRVTHVGVRFNFRVFGYSVLGIGLFVTLSIGLSSLNWGFDISNVWGVFSKAFDFSAGAGESNVIRADQLHVLLTGWESSPVFGYGFGTHPAALIRSVTDPWSYELFYLALLYHVGLVGVAIYVVAVLWLLKTAVHTARAVIGANWFVLPCVMGLLGTLIATTTNPYLDRFDGLWMVFVPVAAVNVFSQSPAFCVPIMRKQMRQVHGLRRR